MKARHRTRTNHAFHQKRPQFSEDDKFHHYYRKKMQTPVKDAVVRLRKLYSVNGHLLK